MATKTAINNDNAPDFRSMFNWGLKITDINELFLIAGHGAVGHPRHAGGIRILGSQIG